MIGKSPEEVQSILAPNELIEKVIRLSVIMALDLWKNTQEILDNPLQLLRNIWMRAFHTSREKLKEAENETSETRIVEIIQASDFYQAATSQYTQGNYFFQQQSLTQV